ncbi:hypothetical protein ABZ446_28555 [Streptomyces sp. NPDC005813]|uniref:hypothetical protein n=1 Tax=Streptomyces sp. NPDC005813 TaxID=3155592 RepID=UPI0034055CA0
MAKAELTEQVVRTETVVLELTLDEARALWSLVRHVGRLADGNGPADRIEDIRQALMHAPVPAAPRDRIFDADGTVRFGPYRSFGSQ